MSVITTMTLTVIIGGHDIYEKHQTVLICAVLGRIYEFENFCTLHIIVVAVIFSYKA